MEVAKIIIFGTTNVGKTSVVNLLFGYSTSDPKAGIEGNSAIGTTFQTQPYEKIIEGKKFVLYDTVGLDEASLGTVDRKKALQYLLDLIIEVKGDLKLIIYVRKCGAKTMLDEKHINFVRSIFADRVPIICVNTNGENAANLMDWWNANQKIMKGNPLRFTDGVSVCCGRGKSPAFINHFEDLRSQSYSLIWDCIKRNLRKDSGPLIEKRSDFVKKFLSAFDLLYETRIFFGVFGLSSLFGPRERGDLERALIQDGYTPDEARQVVLSFTKISE